MMRSTLGAKTKQIIDFLGLTRSVLVLLGSITLASTGERLWLAFAPKYLETLGAGVFLIGAFDALQTLLGAIYAYPGAWLTDRFGQRKSLLLFSLISSLGYIIVYLWPHRYALLVGAFFFLAWSALSLPTTFSVVANHLKMEKHTMGIGVQSLIRRVRMMIGPLIGGWLITQWGCDNGVQLALLCCIVLSGVTFFLQFMMFNEPPDAPTETKKNFTFFEVFRSFPAQLKELLLSDILIRFCERIPYAFVILWVIDQNGLSVQAFSFLVAIELGVAMLCYIPVAHLADKHGQKPFVLITFLFFTLFPLSLLLSHNLTSLAIAFTIRGLKEFGEPARKALIIAYSPPELKSKAYGVYYLIRDCVITLGSFIGAALWKISPQTNFIGSTLFGLAGTLWFYFFIYQKKQ